MKHAICAVTAIALAVFPAPPARAQFTEEELARREALERFLESAEIVSSQQMSTAEGVTQPYRVTLTDGQTRHQAVWKNPSGRMGGYWEGWEYEIAAYRLDKHLGVGMVPPTVERDFQGSRGSIQLWVDAWMSAREKTEQKIPVPPAKILNWNQMTYLQRAFDNLIGNEDRHLGNVLITEDWRMLLIDHSRSFRTGKRFTKRLLYGPRGIKDDKPMTALPRGFVEKVRALDAETLEQVTGGYLKDGEMEAVLARKDLLLEEIEGGGTRLYD